LKTTSNKCELTKTEKYVLHLLTDEFLTVKQIQQRRGCSLTVIYKHINNLKKKGAIDGAFNKVEKIQSTHIKPNSVRLHGQEWNIKILWQDHYFQKKLKKCNTLFIDSNTIRLYRNSIEIYSGNSFFGENEQEATSKSLDYLKRLLARLENDFKITIMKERSNNIKEVNHHYARIDSELCEHALERKKMIRVFAQEDGKLCFITDNSFGMGEDETVHPETAKDDRKAIDKQVNDWRLNNPLTNTEITQIQTETAQNLNILVNTMGEYGKHIKSHTGAIKTLSKAMPELIRTLKELKEENNNLKQRRLSEYE
jgi:DNA-binding CsgD family transcriptional regulator